METVAEPTPRVNSILRWQHAVQEMATYAQRSLPEAQHQRMQKATALVLTGGVWLDEDDTAMVRGSTEGTWYHVNGFCSCEDAMHNAPDGVCKHRLARRLYIRAGALARANVPPAETTPTTPALVTEPTVPEGIASRHMVTIQGNTFIKYAGLLELAHKEGLMSLTVEWTLNTADLSLAHAVAVFADGRRFEECGDASPDNVTRAVKPHFRRVALTRAKARVLRDALGLDIVAEEELAD